MMSLILSASFGQSRGVVPLLFNAWAKIIYQTFIIQLLINFQTLGEKFLVVICFLLDIHFVISTNGFRLVEFVGRSTHVR
jgi:hypothetical protein